MTESGYTPQALPARLRGAVAARGVRPVAGDFARWSGRLAAGLPWTVRGRRGSFEFDGRRLPYLVHPYKRSWLTERAVEVPIVQAAVDACRGRRVLEVGNVLSHYRAQEHVVVDKYERSPGVLNRDVLELGDLGAFDLVVAISTVEHVGWDESPRDPGKALRALQALRELVAPDGRLLVTVPLGYNPALDAALREGQFFFKKLSAMRRHGGSRWRQADPEEVWGVPYDFLMYSARAVLIGDG